MILVHALCYSVSQCIAVYCSVLQCVAMKMCRDIGISADALIIDVAQVGGVTRPSTHPTTISKLWLCLLRVLFASVLCVLFACAFLRRSYATHTTRTTPHTTHHTHHTHHAPHTTHTRTPGWRRLPRERWGAPGQGGVPAHRDQGVLQEGLDTDDLYVQGHPAPGHALETPLPPRLGAGARHVALCPRR